MHTARHFDKSMVDALQHETIFFYLKTDRPEQCKVRLEERYRERLKLISVLFFRS